MKLLTKKIKNNMPKLGETEELDAEDTEIVVKFFTPWSNWTWYAVEGEEQENGDYLFFGWVEGDYPELGYFTLSELKSVSGPMGLGIERDTHYGKHTLDEIMRTVLD